MEKEELLGFVHHELNREVAGVLKDFDTGPVTTSITQTDEEIVYRVKFPHLKEKPFTL